MTKLENDDVVAASANLVTIPKTFSKLPITTYNHFGNYLKLKYLNNEDAINLNEEKEFDYVFNLGLIQAKNNLQRHDSPLLHRGKIPRVDEWGRLGSIASEFLQIRSYPNIPSAALTAILNKALGDRDPRTIKWYRETVLHYCNIDEFKIKRCRDSSLGQLDVSFFVHLIPKQYLTVDATSSTSFEENNQFMPARAVKKHLFGT